jgi:type VI secretion system protein ImpI
VAITLRIENYDQLPDGGPVEFGAGARGFDIGRGQHLDWCLPDDSRFISTTHCEIRYDNGAYWLRDVSKNGTFVNGAEGRVQSPYRLANGDRLKIGHYFIAVAIDGDAAQPPQQQFAPQQQPADYGAPPDGDIWSVGAAAPQPVDRRWFAGEQRPSRRAPDVLEHFIDLPAARTPAQETPFSQPSHPPQAPAQQAWPAQTTSFPQPFPPAAPMPGGPVPGAPMPGASMPAPVAPPAPGYPAPGGFQGSADMGVNAFIAAIATAAGMSPQALSGRPPDEVAAELGAILRTVTEQLSGLLRARAAAKLMAKSSNRTMITAQNNNPLKFIPDVREAMDVMFTRNRSGYLSAAQSFKEGFENIKSHELATFSAMQTALARIMDDLSPDIVEDRVGSSGFGNKKARAWELYVERWNAKTEPYENGVLDLFLIYFAEAYDAANKS